MALNNITKSAILMLSLGEDGAAEVMKHLSQADVHKLSLEMAKINDVPHEHVEQTLSEFIEAAGGSSGIGIGSDEYIRSVLIKALGIEKASTVMEGIVDMGTSSGFDGLKWLDPDTISEMIKDEHPQIIATILVHLDAEQSSKVLSNFTARNRQDVILRIATLDGVKPAALRDLNDVLSKLVSGNDNLRKQSMGGVKAAAEIMNYLSTEEEGILMAGIKNYDETMAQKIMDEMFVFDNILDIDDRGVQTVLKEVQSDSLIIALKGASEEMKDKIFRNMSARAAEMLQDDLETKGPVRLSEVESEQKAILTIVRRLADSGQIALGAKGEDVFV